MDSPRTLLLDEAIGCVMVPQAGSIYSPEYLLSWWIVSLAIHVRFSVVLQLMNKVHGPAVALDHENLIRRSMYF